MKRYRVDLDRVIAQNGEAVFVDSEQNFEVGDRATFKPPYKYTVEGPIGRNDVSADPGNVFDGEVPITGKIAAIVFKQ